MAALAKDTFTRSNTTGNTTISNAQGWTTASDGEAWSAAGGFTYTYSIASNTGKVTGTTGIEYAILGSNTQADGSTLVRLQASASGCYMGVTFRYTDLNNWYRAYIGIGDTNLYLDKNVAGSSSTVATATITSPSTSTLYWVRLYVKGTTIQVKMWPSSGGEPGTWNISTTDSSLTGAHQYGVLYNCASSGNTIQFDSFEVDALTSTNTIPATTALLLTSTRTIPDTTALLQTSTRTIPATTSLSGTARVIPATTALLATNTRTVPATTALLNTSTRVVPSTSALLQTSTRVVPATTALTNTSARTVTATTALLRTLTRSIPATTALTNTSTRSIPATTSLYTPAVFYASNIASTIGGLTLSDQMSQVTGGTETSYTVTAPSSGSNSYVELVSQGGTPGSTPVLPSPTGKGWSISLAGNTIVAGNWNGVFTLAKSGTTKTGASLIVRWYRRTIDGTSYPIGVSTLSSQSYTTTKTVYITPSVYATLWQFISGDTLYMDAFVYNGGSTAWASDVFTIYVSNSATQGVVNEGEIIAPTIAQTAPGVSYFCGIPNFQALNALPVSNQALNLADALDQRSILTLTGEDALGTTSTPRGTPVILSDSSQGLLYTGNTQSDEMTHPAVGSNPQIEHMHTDHDNHYWFDKNPNVTNYANWYAGDIVCDFLQKLAVEGVTGQFAIESDYTPATFGSGTLSGTVATTTSTPFVYAPNTASPPITTNTGDLELTRAGTQFMLTESVTSDFSSGSLTNMVASNNELTPSTQSAIKVTAQYSPVAGTINVDFTESGGAETDQALIANLIRASIWTGTMTVGTNDTLNYDIWISSTSPAFQLGVDILFSDGSHMTDNEGFLDNPSSLGLFDSNGVSVDIMSDLSAYAKDTWYTRTITLTGLNGKTINEIDVFLASSASGNYTFYVKNVYLGSQSGSPFFGTTATSVEDASKISGIGAYITSSITRTVVKVFNPLVSNRVSGAHSISGVGLVQNSTITWAASLPTTGAAQIVYPPGTQASSATSTSSGTSPAMVMMVSYDANTWLICQNSQALPGLPPGANVSGLSLYLREQFAAGSDPTAIPALLNVQITINSAANQTVSDVTTAYGTSTQWNTGTQVLTGPNSNGNLTLGSSSNPLTQTWPSSAVLNQQTFLPGAFNSGTQAVSGGAYTLTPGAQPTGGSWCQGRFDWGGYFQNGIIEADVKVSSTSIYAEASIEYKQTGWGNANDNYAYVVGIQSTGGVFLAYGSNSAGNTAGTFTSLASPGVTIAANTYYHLKIVVNGNRHTVYFNHSGSPSIDVLDDAYTAAGQIGFRAYTSSTSSFNASIKNFSMVTTTSGVWTSPSTPLTSLGTCGYNQICWTDLDSRGQVEANTTVFASTDNGSTWQQCTNGAQIPQLARGTSTSGMNLILQAVLYASTPPISTPVLMGLYARICGPYGTVTGTRISPVLNLSPVTYESSSNVMYNSNTPTSTAIAVATTINAGSSWETVANSGAGAALSYWTPQPAPTQDLFGSNTGANYTNTNKTGGSTASVLYTPAQSQLSLSGGSFGLYLSNAPTSIGDIEVACCLSQSDTGGLVFHYVDANNYYELVVYDASSSGGATNTVQLYSIKSNVRTLLGSTNITFTRGTFHIAKATMKSGLINAFWDGQCILSYLDTSPLGSGLAGLRNSGGTSLYYQLWIQPLGSNLSGVGLQTKVTLSTSDPSQMPQLFVLVCAVRGPHITQGQQIYQMHPLTVPFAAYYSTEMDMLSQADGDSFWYVDKYGECLFQSRYARLGAFPLQTINDPANASGLLLYKNADGSPLKVTTASDTFRNQQVITNVTTLITPPIEYKVADGTATSWTLGYPVYSTPTITFITSGQYATVGQQGIDSGRQIYWQPGSNSLSYDSSLPVLPDGTIFSVQYVGQSINNLIINNSSSQAVQAALEGNSGIVAEIESALRATTIGMTTAQATNFANGLLNRNGISNATEVLGTIMYAGLKPGTFVPVFAPEFGLWNVQLPIVKMTTTALPAATGLPVYQYLVDATNGANISNWQRVFGIA